MKIAFLVTRIEKPGSRYRVLQYIPILKKEGYKADVFVIPKNLRSRSQLFRKMRDFDIVFLYKKLLNFVELHLLRKNSKHLIYDFDDAVMFRDSKHNHQVSGSRMTKFIRTIKNADVVIAGNEYLKMFSVKENPKTFVIPTSIDINRYTEKPKDKESNSLIIGWIGSKSTLFYLENMKYVWDKIFELFPFVSLKIIADTFFDCLKMPVIKKPWSYEDEIEDLHTFDIGLMPLTDDPWSRGKCGFKLLQYMAVGIPPVCSPIGTNRDIVNDGKNGFWAMEEHEWIKKIGYLIKNPELRLQMGEKARETVIKNFSADLNIKKLIHLFSINNP